MTETFEPPYPADLLDRMAKILALAGMCQLRGEPGIPADIAEVLDEYALEVGRHQCPDEVWQAMGALADA